MLQLVLAFCTCTDSFSHFVGECGTQKVSEYDQEIPQSKTADLLTASWGRATGDFYHLDEETRAGCFVFVCPVILTRKRERERAGCFAVLLLVFGCPVILTRKRERAGCFAFGFWMSCYLDEEERAGCFAFVFWMSCYLDKEERAGCFAFVFWMSCYLDEEERAGCLLLFFGCLVTVKLERT